MTQILKNKDLEIHIDSPFENYTGARFDRTGKIVAVKFHNIPLTTIERTGGADEHAYGKGLYNEFGINTAIGFEETEVGGWFHKIGVGMLKKEDPEYLFSRNYHIKPVQFHVFAESTRAVITCISEYLNGYSYVLRKEIELKNSGFTITYILENTGDKNINTTEYVHNFMAVNNELIGKNYKLRFSFPLNPDRFDDTVNPESKVDIGQHEIAFNGTPKEQFFFSNLSGGETVDASWELLNLEHNIAVGESGNFKTNKINLWGWNHVISPELFYEISLKPGQSAQWARNYKVRRIA